MNLLETDASGDKENSLEFKEIAGSDDAATTLMDPVTSDTGATRMADPVPASPDILFGDLLTTDSTDSMLAPGVVSPIFGPSVGAVLGEYACTQNDFRGTLYAATEAICFYSTGFWGTETCRLVLPYQDVTAIQHIEDGLSIKTFTMEKKTITYEFTKMNYRDPIFNLLVSLHEKAPPGPRRSVLLTPPPAKKDISGSSTDVRSSMRKRRSLRQTPIAIAIDQVHEMEAECTEQDYLAACEVAAMADFSKSQRNLAQEMKAGNLSETGTATAEKYGKSVPKDMLQAWIDVRNAQCPAYSEVTILNLHLSCDIDSFFENFLSDGAQHSMRAFQEDKFNDTDIETTSWRLSKDDDFSLTRTLAYTHPVNVPMAPPSARATKEQCLRRFGDHGIVLETHTVVNDVPLTDCFFVDDQMLVEPKPEGGVSLMCRFEVRFVKRTMFRSIIQSQTKSEVISAHKEYAKFLTATTEKKMENVPKNIPVVITEKEIVEEAAPEKEPVAAYEPSIVSAKWSIIGFVLAVLLITLQANLIVQVHQMNISLSHVTENQDKLFELLQTNSEYTGATCTSSDIGVADM